MAKEQGLCGQRFDRLCTDFHVHSRVALRTPPGGERGLYTTEPVRAGEPVLAVPFELCLVCEDAQPLDSPWDTPHVAESTGACSYPSCGQVL